MTVTYLGHSGFLVELDEAYMLFDYHEGKFPALAAAKPLFIFVSHAHHDHYDTRMWSYAKTNLTVYFVVSTDVSTADTRPSPAAMKTGRVSIMGADESRQITADVAVSTLLSTDEGVAFIIQCGGKRLFHAGDLNLWTWPGDEGEKNDDRLRRFMLEMDKIRGMGFDAAFFPLDPRQGAYCGDGMRIFCETVDAAMVFPMHMWGDFTVIGTFLAKHPCHAAAMVRIERKGQVFL